MGPRVLTVRVVVAGDLRRGDIMLSPLKQGEVHILRNEILDIHVDERFILVELLADFLHQRGIAHRLPILDLLAHVQQVAGDIVELLRNLEPLRLRLNQCILCGICEIFVVVLQRLVLILYILDELHQLTLLLFQL